MSDYPCDWCGALNTLVETVWDRFGRLWMIQRCLPCRRMLAKMERGR